MNWVGIETELRGYPTEPLTTHDKAQESIDDVVNGLKILCSLSKEWRDATEQDHREVWQCCYKVHVSVHNHKIYSEWYEKVLEKEQECEIQKWYH